MNYSDRICGAVHVHGPLDTCGSRVLNQMNVHSRGLDTPPTARTDTSSRTALISSEYLRIHLLSRRPQFITPYFNLINVTIMAEQMNHSK